MKASIWDLKSEFLTSKESCIPGAKALPSGSIDFFVGFCHWLSKTVSFSIVNLTILTPKNVDGWVVGGLTAEQKYPSIFFIFKYTDNHDVLIHIHGKTGILAHIITGKSS